MRRSRTSTTTTVAFALAGLAAAAAGPLSAPASAAVPVNPVPIPAPCLLPFPTTPATDLVKLTGLGVDFGTGGLNSSSDPTCSATVEWKLGANTITPTVKGDLSLKNSQGLSARVLVAYKDIHGNSLGPNRVTATKVAQTNNLETFPVTIDGFSSPLVYEVQVATQRLNAGLWEDVDRESLFLSSSTQPNDPVLISAVGQDFGTGNLVNGVPPTAGALNWITSNGTVRAQLTGDLIMTTSDGINARMRLKTYDVYGIQLSSTPSGTHQPNTNAETHFAINMTSPTNPLIFKAVTSIEVEIGAGSGNWQQVGPSVTSFI